MHEAKAVDGFADRVEALLGEQLAYKIPHAAKVLDMGERKVWDLVQSGAIESFQIGRSRRITRAALLAYLERMQTAA